MKSQILKNISLVSYLFILISSSNTYAATIKPLVPSQKDEAIIFIRPSDAPQFIPTAPLTEKKQTQKNDIPSNIDPMKPAQGISKYEAFKKNFVLPKELLPSRTLSGEDYQKIISYTDKRTEFMFSLMKKYAEAIKDIDTGTQEQYDLKLPQKSLPPGITNKQSELDDAIFRKIQAWEKRNPRPSALPSEQAIQNYMKNRIEEIGKDKNATENPFEGILPPTIIEESKTRGNRS